MYHNIVRRVKFYKHIYADFLLHKKFQKPQVSRGKLSINAYSKATRGKKEKKISNYSEDLRSYQKI